MTRSVRSGDAAAGLLLAALSLVVALLLPGCRTPGGARVAPAAPHAPLVLLVLDRQRVAPGREWRFRDRVDGMIDAAVQARTGADFPLDGWASLAGDGKVTVVAVPAPGGTLARAVAGRLALALGDEERVVLSGPSGPGSPPGAWVLVACPAVGDDGTVRHDGADVAARLREAGWPAPGLVLADLTRPPVGGKPWEAREILAGTDPSAVAEVARWQLRGRLTGKLPPPDEAPRVRLAVLPVGD